MSSYHCLWHITGRILAWFTLLLAVGKSDTQPLLASVRRGGEPATKGLLPDVCCYRQLQYMTSRSLAQSGYLT